MIKSAERWFAMAGVIVMTSVSVAGLAVAIYAAWLFHDLPDSTRLAEYRPPTATRVYAWDGTLIGEFSRERRIFVPYDRIPPTLVQAFLAAEDRNFFNHGGVDFTGLSRAMAKNVSNLVNGRRLEGGSTITQQVAKNIQLSSEVTVGRKLKEVILARRLESTLDKKQILELYLNEIFLGYRSFGVASAAFNYFGKSLDDLTIAEMAYLASLPKGPANYHPIRFKQSAVERRNWILGEMHKLGWITEAEYQTALKEDLVVQNAPMRARYRDADYFLEEVRRQGTTAFGEKLFSGGYYLRTTLDAEMQTSARDALMRGLELYDYRHGWRGASASGDPKGDWKPQASKLRIPAERTKWVGAIVESSAGGNVRVTTVKDDKGRIRDADVIWANASKPLKKGDIVIVEELTRGVMALRQVPRVNGALVAIDPWSGRVLAMVGGYSFSLSKFNRATQAYRQPGSAFKPFVYAAALEGDFTPASIVVDGPISFKGANGKVWSPKNYSRRYYGPQTLRKGLELSRNAMTVRLANRVGMKTIREKAIRYGVVDDMQPVLSMALGSGETTPYKITAAYAAFANGGYRVNPHVIEVAHDRDGKNIANNDKRRCPGGCGRAFDGGESPRLNQAGEQVMDPITAYQITSYLEGVIQRGTAVRAQVLDRPVAGKTGTTNEYRSAWFVGYTPDLVVGVFVGYDENRPLGSGETGSSAALPIFVDFLQDVLKDKPKKPFKAPKDAVMVSVRGHLEAFRPGTEPKVVAPPPPSVDGPRPYVEVWRNGEVSQTPAKQTPAPKPTVEQADSYVLY